MVKKKDDDNIISFRAEIERLKNALQAKDEIDSIQTTRSIHSSRLMEEKTDENLRIMNINYAFVRSIGTKPLVMAKVYNEYYKREINEFITPDSVIIREANIGVVGEKGQILPRGKWWLGHMHRKDYETVTFEPHKEPGEYQDNRGKLYFNMWEGFSITPKKGSWKITKKHIWKILCNKNPIKFKYVMRWLAWSVQNPGERAEVAIIFKGKKGAGKGFIFTQMIKLFGRHGMAISNREHLTGKHNEHLQNLSFLFADEAYYPGDKEVEGVLKNIITEPTLTTEPKFRAVKLNRNCLHIGMATNSDWVIPATEDERRYFINTVDNIYAKNATSDAIREAYFVKLWGEMNEHGLAAMLYDLQNIKLNGWHPRTSVPDTEELKNQIELSLSYPKRAMYHLIENGIFPGTRDSLGRLIISNTNLVKYFQSLDARYKVITFKVVSDLCQELKLETGRTGAMGRFYIFPELYEIRERWNRFLTSKINWKPDETWYVQSKDYGI